MSFLDKFLDYMSLAYDDEEDDDEEDNEYWSNPDSSSCPNSQSKQAEEVAVTFLYEIDFNSFKELPECALQTLVCKVVSADGHETGISAIVIPIEKKSKIIGDDFGRLTAQDRKHLEIQLEEFFNALP